MRAWWPLALLAMPFVAQATVDCSTAGLAQPQAVRPTVMAPLSAELASPNYLLGAQGGVLAHAYDESQSVDQVLLRQRLERCRPVASVVPAPGSVDPNDPAAYKPKTEFDNTPWRFDMSQDGKRMTAEEFDAWMKARGVRVARGAAPAPASAPPAVPVPPGDGTPLPAAPPAAVPPGAPPGALPTQPAPQPPEPEPEPAGG